MDGYSRISSMWNLIGGAKITINRTMKIVLNYAKIAWRQENRKNGTSSSK